MAFEEGGDGVLAGKSDGGGGFDIRGKRESGEGWLRMRCFLLGQSEGVRFLLNVK